MSALELFFIVAFLTAMMGCNANCINNQVEFEDMSDVEQIGM